MNAKLEKLVSEFAGKYSLPELKRDQDGRFEWYVDGKAVSFFDGAGKIYVMAEVCKLPEGKPERDGLLKSALKASLANADANQESLYIDSEADTLCLYSSLVSKGASFFDFEALLETFMNTLDGLAEIAASAPAAGRHHQAMYLPG